MKILFIANRGEIGGAHNALENTIKFLKNKGYELTVLTPNKNSKWIEFSKKNNINCFYIKYFEIGYAFNIPLIRRIVKFLLLPVLIILNRLNIINAKKINKIIDIKSYDYIHTNTNRDDFGILLSKIYNLKHIMHLREFDKEFFKIIYLRRNIYKYFNDNTQIFISVSDVIKNKYIEKGLDKEKITTVYDGIDSETIPIKKEYENKDIYNFLMVSNICKEKGHEKIIEAISKSRFVDKINIDFYGTGSYEYIKYLKQIVNKKGLNKNITFKGYDNNIKTKIYKYDLALMCSKYDGFGLVTVEYMMAGVPVLVSNTGANYEIVNDNETGIIFDFNNEKSLIEKIDFIVENYEIIKEIGKKGYQFAKERFDLNTTIENLCKVYERGKKNEN